MKTITKKVLYISYDGMTDPLGQSQVLPYIIELSKKGYEFTLLSFEKKIRYEAEKHIIDKKISEYSIRWEPLFFTSKPPVLSKAYDRWQLKRKAISLHKKERFDLVHCRSYIAAEAGLLLKRKTGVKFLFDMRGFWADERVDNGQWDLKNFFYRKLYNQYKKKEKEFLLTADGIVSLTKAAKDLLLTRPEYKHISIEVIPCCADLDHFDFAKISKEQSAELKHKLGISPENKVITYLGSIGGWYMTDEMFGFYKRLLLKYPGFVMLILTKDNKETVIKEAGMLGIPVICNDIGDTGDIIETTETGAVVRTFSDNEYDKIIEKLPELLGISKKLIRKAAFDYFDLKMGAESYASLYNKILN